MFKKNNRDTMNYSEIDSFYNSKIVGLFTDNSIRNNLNNLLAKEGFDNVKCFIDLSAFLNRATNKKHDLIIFDLRSTNSKMKGYDLLDVIRRNDPDSAIITLSQNNVEMRRHLELSINQHFHIPYNNSNLIKAMKKAIGNKISHDIGMQFFDALFGMQMCTHRDLHLRTFDHVIRTTKIYGKFLLYLYKKKMIELTSWILKNCLIASMLHDIGKLLVMHGVLYKEGKLSQFEYQQVKRHPWNSITALLGGQDIDFFADFNKPLETVSGYKERNLGKQVQKWIFKVMDNDMSALNDVEHFFADMVCKPSIHSLNRDLLYIVFRHHYGLTTSYHNDDELDQFSKIIDRDVKTDLTRDSLLDVVTNALSICDMYDALLDTKRDYRESSYRRFFALLLLYCEMKKDKFFPHISKQFIKFIIEAGEMDAKSPFYEGDDADLAYQAIENIYDSFNITKDKEWDLDNFITQHSQEIKEFAVHKNSPEFAKLQQQWFDYFDDRQQQRLSHFIAELNNVSLIHKPIEDFSSGERKTFDMLFHFYYSYSSSYKQKMLIEYLLNTVLKPQLSDEVKKKMIHSLENGDIKTRNDIEKVFLRQCYERRNIFEVFKNYDEDILITELNDFLQRCT